MAEPMPVDQMAEHRPAEDVIRKYLQDAIAAEDSFESQLRSFSAVGDDAEVQAVFAIHANETAVQSKRLTVRLGELGGAPSAVKTVLAHLFSLTPRTAQLTHTPDERLVQNLIAAFAVETSECAMYEALAAVAQAKGDAITERLARDIQSEEQQTALKLWSFIPSRAKIAFNLLTAGELDPAVETKLPDDRLL